jgi:hypothetical protein
MAQFIDERYGRQRLVSLLAASSNQEILAALGLTEGGFFQAWEVWLRAR